MCVTIAKSLHAAANNVQYVDSLSYSIIVVVELTAEEAAKEKCDFLEHILELLSQSLLQVVLCVSIKMISYGEHSHGAT